MGKSFKEHGRLVGRPSKLTRMLQEKICKHILQGKSIEEAICEAGISRTSFWRYRKNSSFARAIDEAWGRYWKEEGERFMEEISEERIDKTIFLPLKRRRRQRKRLAYWEYKKRLERCRDEKGRFCQSG